MAVNKGSWKHTASSLGGSLTGVNADGELDIAEMDAGTVNVAADSFAFNDADDSETYEESIADLVSGIASTGLVASAGTLAVDLDGCGDAAIDVAADTIPFIDESATGDPTKLESVADLVAGIASTGLVASSGTLAVDLDGCGDATIDVANDTIAFVDESAEGDPTKLEAVADLVTAMAGDGILATSGVLSIDLDELGDAAIDVAADTLVFIDEGTEGDPTKLESVADLVTAVAGTQATSALIATSGVLAVAPTEVAVDVANDSVVIKDATDSAIHTEAVADLATAMAGDGLSATSGVLAVDANELTGAVADVAADSIPFIDATDNSTKKESIADLAGLMAGAGLSASSGVMAASNLGIAHHADDNAHSVFFIQGECDFGASTAISVDLGAIGTKGTLIGGYWYLTEAQVNGDAPTVLTLGKATGGGSPIAATLTITLANTGDGQSNEVGMMRAVIPAAGGIDMAATDHVWIDTPDDVAGGRSAGKVSVFLWFQKSA